MDHLADARGLVCPVPPNISPSLHIEMLTLWSRGMQTSTQGHSSQQNGDAWNLANADGSVHTALAMVQTKLPAVPNAPHGLCSSSKLRSSEGGRGVSRVPRL